MYAYNHNNYYDYYNDNNGFYFDGSPYYCYY